MMWGCGGPWFFGMGFFMWLIPAVLIGWAIWGLSGNRRPAQDDHLAVLRRRLARGEISEAEYTRIKELLR